MKVPFVLIGVYENNDMVTSFNQVALNIDWYNI